MRARSDLGTSPGELAERIERARHRVVMCGLPAPSAEVSVAVGAALARGVSVTQTVASDRVGDAARNIVDRLLEALVAAHDYRLLTADHASVPPLLVVDDTAWGGVGLAELDALLARLPAAVWTYGIDTEQERASWQRRMALYEKGFDERWLFKPTPSIAVRPPKTMRRIIESAADDPDAERLFNSRRHRAANLFDRLEHGAIARDLHILESLEDFQSGATGIARDDAEAVLDNLRALSRQASGYQVAAVSRADIPFGALSFEIVRRGNRRRVLIDASPGSRAVVRHSGLVGGIEQLFDHLWQRSRGFA